MQYLRDITTQDEIFQHPGMAKWSHRKSTQCRKYAPFYVGDCMATMKRTNQILTLYHPCVVLMIAMAYIY